MTTAADYTSVRFLEPFLNACDAPTLLAATAVCKTWAASAKTNSLWRPLVLRRWPLPWLQCDGQDACNWLKRYATLSKGVPAATQADDDESDPAAMLEELKASHQFFLVARSAHWSSETAWKTGDVEFSCPLQLGMGRRSDLTRDRLPDDGIVLDTGQLEVPAMFHPAVRCFLAYEQRSRGYDMDLAIYAKSTEDHRVAHMLTLPGCALSHEDEHLLCVYEGSLSDCPLKQRDIPKWTRCIVHADRSAGPSDDFEVDLYFDGEDNYWFSDEGHDNFSCTRMQFVLYRRARDARLPMCVRDMPAILEKLVWA